MSNSDRPIGAALLLFPLSGFIAMVLLTTALVAWLSELVGSIGLASDTSSHSEISSRR